MPKKGKKDKKPLFTKKQLEKDFTMPGTKHVLPEGIDVHSIHVSRKVDSKGRQILYDSRTNTMVKWHTTSIVAFNMAMNDGDHHAALHRE